MVGCLWVLRQPPPREHTEFWASNCVVNRPCACACISLLIALLFTIIGWLALLAAVPEDSLAGPIRLNGLDYPSSHQICKVADAIYKAVEDSEKVMESYQQSLEELRSSEVGSGEEKGDAFHARQLLTQASSSIVARNTPRRRRAESTFQTPQQEEELSTAVRPALLACIRRLRSANMNTAGARHTQCILTQTICYSHRSQSVR
eukprot:6210977-Pleurochrysis_carterae.AAC.2